MRFHNYVFEIKGGFYGVAGVEGENTTCLYLGWGQYALHVHIFVVS
jgi:hypothetical protein